MVRPYTAGKYNASSMSDGAARPSRPVDHRAARAPRSGGARTIPTSSTSEGQHSGPLGNSARTAGTMCLTRGPPSQTTRGNPCARQVARTGVSAARAPAESPTASRQDAISAAASSSARGRRWVRIRATRSRARSTARSCAAGVPSASNTRIAESSSSSDVISAMPSVEVRRPTGSSRRRRSDSATGEAEPDLFVDQACGQPR